VSIFFASRFAIVQKFGAILMIVIIPRIDIVNMLCV
jgi:hypothetical protein